MERIRDREEEIPQQRQKGGRNTPTERTRQGGKNTPTERTRDREEENTPTREEEIPQQREQTGRKKYPTHITEVEKKPVNFDARGILLTTPDSIKDWIHTRV